MKNNDELRMVIDIPYGDSLLLPTELGMELIEILRKAENYRYIYSKDIAEITPFDFNALKIKFMTSTSYKSSKFIGYLTKE